MQTENKKDNDNNDKEKETIKTNEKNNDNGNDMAGIEKLNQTFGENFKIDQKRLFGNLLFKKNNQVYALNNNPIRYEEEITSDVLTQFVKKELNLTLLLEGRLEEWNNNVTTEFIKFDQEKQLEKINQIEKEMKI